MPVGKYKDKCLDTSEQRNIRILRDRQAAPFSPTKDEMVVANFRHGGKFWIAKIPLGGVEQLIVQREDFGTLIPAAHAQLRFKMKPGQEIVLYPQNTDPKPKPVHRLSDLVYSAEPVGPEDVAFDIASVAVANLPGANKNLPQYVIATRFTSLSERAHKMITIDKHQVVQFPLNTTNAENRKILEAGLRQSDKQGYSTLFDVFQKQCDTQMQELFRGIKRGPINDVANGVFFLDNMYPSRLEQSFRNKGLLDETALKKTPTLNNELRQKNLK
jgi:hypothetical protein